MGVYLSQNCVRFAEKSPDEYNWLAEPYAYYRDKSIAENKNLAMSIWYAYGDGAYDEYGLEFSELSEALKEYAIVTIKNNPKDYFHQVVFLLVA